MANNSQGRRRLVVFVGIVLTLAVAWLLFYAVPDSLVELFGILLVVVTGVLGARFVGRLAAHRFPDYDVAEVAVSGPISRDGRGGVPSRSGTPADAIVEQIEKADEDSNAQALLLRLNTPGGEVVPSEDIRLAAERFEGPTVAYATDVCASGGYWIASGCDEMFARDASLVGSIGVIGSRVNAADLADRLGLSYERFAAGKYKDAGVSLKEIGEDEREYLQGLIDGLYDDFVRRVTAGRDLDAETVRETEARVYLGDEAHDLGLVDELGTREDVEERIAERLGVPEVSVQEFEPRQPLRERLNVGAQSVAYSFGAGVASVLGGDESKRVEGFEFRVR
ncbi:signal peptide peptidase SppA [Haladaptatus pallidirubidus]|uniref:Peptidase S49 domain-containing protein n=1 Tax=Haladaptatus pallidirubidus TaxID=1008152 RepID=A0AAV3ULE2_9EURY|nr:signal peptide peptidase SppA [Haladaptatus pallidirubidus]